MWGLYAVWVRRLYGEVVIQMWLYTYISQRRSEPKWWCCKHFAHLIWPPARRPRGVLFPVRTLLVYMDRTSHATMQLLVCIAGTKKDTVALDSGSYSSVLCMISCSPLDHLLSRKHKECLYQPQPNIIWYNYLLFVLKPLSVFFQYSASDTPLVKVHAPFHCCVLFLTMSI